MTIKKELEGKAEDFTEDYKEEKKPKKKDDTKKRIDKLESCVRDKDKRISKLEHRFNVIKRWVLQLTIWFLVTLPVALLIYFTGFVDFTGLDLNILIFSLIGFGCVAVLMGCGYLFSIIWIWIDDKGDGKYP